MHVLAAAGLVDLVQEDHTQLLSPKDGLFADPLLVDYRSELELCEDLQGLAPLDPSPVLVGAQGAKGVVELPADLVGQVAARRRHRTEQSPFAAKRVTKCPIEGQSARRPRTPRHRSYSQRSIPPEALRRAARRMTPSRL